MTSLSLFDLLVQKIEAESEDNIDVMLGFLVAEVEGLAMALRNTLKKCFKRCVSHYRQPRIVFLSLSVL
jgi:hypothetical protein